MYIDTILFTIPGLPSANNNQVMTVARNKCLSVVRTLIHS